MTDETPLARALRIAMQNHTTAYGGRNALDQGDYGYGTPVTYSTPNALSSSGLQHQGPWMRDYMPNTLADLLSQILTYAPMAVPAMRGRVMENGLRPQDYAINNKMVRDGQNKVETVLDPIVNSEALARVYPKAMRDFKPEGRQDGSTYFALPEEVQAWARQQPANMSDAAYLQSTKPSPVSDPYRQALRDQWWKNQGKATEEFRPFDVIPGGKE